jgi:DnaJ-class molecular chaperone
VAAISAAEVRALAMLVDELDYYQLLEIPRDTPASGVKRAYYSVTRRLHPDANRDLPAADREVLENVARRVSEAYQVLRDGRRRNAYDAQLAAGAGGRIRLAEAEAQADREAVAHHLGRTPNGRRYFNLARGDIDRGDLASAQRNLRTALTFEPDNAYFKQKLDEVTAALRSTQSARAPYSR